MRERSILGVDILLVLATIALVTTGVLFIYSSSVTSGGDSFSNEWIRQLVWASIGLVMLVGLSLVDYSRIRDWTPYIYGAAIAGLIATLLFGRVVNGARSWIGIGELGVQPSEFGKIAVVLLLAKYLEQRRSSIRNPATFLVSLVIVAVPMGLVLLQPDPGTALVYAPIFLVMAFVAGVRPSYLVFLVGTGAMLVVFTVVLSWQQFVAAGDGTIVQIMSDTRLFMLVIGALVVVAVIGLLGVFVLKRRAFGWVTYAVAMVTTSLVGSFGVLRLLKGYQLMRLVVFLNPNTDPRGAGWNIIQSVTAIGSGGIAGKGWLQGTQSHLQYLPEQSTDFIFSILAEEWGFLGALGVLAAYAIIMIRGLVICAKAKDNFATYAGAGIVAMIFYHVAVNVGMAMGIMPVTGIPLLLLSYGGSSLWTAMASIGLLMSIYQHRYRY